jgi:hypothetical protein
MKTTGADVERSPRASARALLGSAVALLALMAAGALPWPARRMSSPTLAPLAALHVKPLCLIPGRSSGRPPSMRARVHAQQRTVVSNRAPFSPTATLRRPTPTKRSRSARARPVELARSNPPGLLA